MSTFLLYTGLVLMGIPAAMLVLYLVVILSGAFWELTWLDKLAAAFILGAVLASLSLMF